LPGDPGRVAVFVNKRLEKKSISGTCFAYGLAKVSAKALWTIAAYNIQQKIRLCRP
jgi:hypothetical protein